MSLTILSAQFKKQSITDLVEFLFRTPSSALLPVANYCLTFYFASYSDCRAGGRMLSPVLSLSNSILSWMLKAKPGGWGTRELNGEDLPGLGGRGRMVALSLQSVAE